MFKRDFRALLVVCVVVGTLPAGATTSGRRLNGRTLEVTDKIKGALVDTVQYKVSLDHKTMTLTVHEKGQPTPLQIIYDWQQAGLRGGRCISSRAHPS